VWNWGGDVLAEEVFLPYDGGPPAGPNELKIKSKGSTGSDRVLLANGRILIPKSRYEDVKRLLDEMNGKRTPE